MHNLKDILADPMEADRRVKRRAPDASFDEVLALAEERRKSISEHDELRAKQKSLSATAFGRKDMASDEQAAARAELKTLSQRVKELDSRAKACDLEVQERLLHIPNLVDDCVPDGYTEESNVVVRSWGEPREMAFEAKTHDKLGVDLGILDFEAASRLSGARFALYRGLGARLERALWNFMLDLHVQEHGYEEVLTPFLVNRDSMTGTGQLPKFQEDAFHVESDDLFLIPTAEVPVTNIHRGAILSVEDLPIKYVAFSACFRREAGSYGKDTHGLTRLHQFQKVELVQFTTPEESSDRHEALTGQAEVVLQRLGLPYRVSELCAGDIGFSAARCYDLEVWLPGQNHWREISSCSNFRDFQARRAGIRYRPEAGAKPRFVHTLNGSGLAVGRTIMAILEHYQREDGGIDLPGVLWPYMGTKSIEPRT
jgi:seryl-tRNA synthetase